MEIQYVHVKTRSQFGKQCIFDIDGPTAIENVLPNRELMEDYIYRNPCHVGVQKSKRFAVHEVQTASATTKESGMSHTEGGWPKEFNPKDEEATARYRRRIEKDDNWPLRMKSLMKPMEHYVLQNNAVNIYDNFFDDMVTTELVLPLDVRTVNVYEDPQTVVRPITHLSWSPDRGKRLAVSYCWMEFQRGPGDLNPWSYIWDIENPNKAFMALKATCPSVTMEFNPRDPSMLISGLMSGQVCSWDIRTGNRPVQISHLQFSHRNPTNLALWINSKSNAEFFSASTGGAMKWWDTRKLREPTETLVMDLENPGRGDVVRAIGVSSLQYEPTMGTKFMTGMENGIVVSGTRKGKNAQEKLALRFVCHDGPVSSIDRNPFSTKNFLTVGGRVAKIWAEDTREGNLISTKQHRAPLAGGCWSTSRYSVFYVIDGDGTLEAYDVLVGMKSPVKTIRLCENGLKAIAPHEEGIHVAVGCDRGKVYLVESSEALTTNSRNDKAIMTAYLDRCSRYEKAIDNRLKEIRLGRRLTENKERVGEEPIAPVTPIKGKSKVTGKDPRVRDTTNDKRPEDKAGRGTAPGTIEDRDKRSGTKIKRVKDNLTSSGDPELDDAELRYYEIVRKEMEKYAEIAALDVKDGEAVSASASSPSATTETSTGARRRKNEDSKPDKESAGAKRGSPAKRDDVESRKRRKSEGVKTEKHDVATEEIVIVRKSKRDKTDQRHDDRKTFDELERITEENDELGTMEKLEKICSTSNVTKAGRNVEQFRVDGKKNAKLEKRRQGKIEKPCKDFTCRPDVCCADETESSIRSKFELPESTSSTNRGIDENMKIAIDDMLANLPKNGLASKLAPSMTDVDDEPTRETTTGNEEREILTEEAKIAERETRELAKFAKHKKIATTTKLENRRSTKNLEIDEISTNREGDTENVRDSRKSGNDESQRAAMVGPGERFGQDGGTGRRKTRDDCEPVSLRFGAKEIRNIIGITDAPEPEKLRRSDANDVLTTRRNDYPRISAAAIPKLDIRNDEFERVNEDASDD